MTLNLIDKKMIVKNTIEIQPSHTYTYASEECFDLESYEITEPGTYGQLDSGLTKIKNQTSMDNSQNSVNFSKTFLINKNYSNENNLTALQQINNIKFLNQYNEYTQETADRVLSSAGFSQDTSSEFKFGVETVRQKYLVEDKNYFKKKSIKNLYKYYQDNMQHRVINPQLGFSNYSCLNFFNIYAKKNLGKTHTNCLAYPNPSFEGSFVYPFLEDSNDLTISFYINQNNKNLKSFNLNPGCVLFIEGIIGIYVIQGSNRDKTGLTDQFRLAVFIGDSLLKNSEFISLLNQGIGNSSSIELDDNNKIACCISKDNIIKYNNWQNVTVSLQKSIEDQSENFVLEIFVDSKKVDNFDISFSKTNANENFVSIQENNVILVGNKFLSDDVNDLYYKLFSINESNNDGSGPYVNKNISFGKKLKNSYFVEETSSSNYRLNNILIEESNNDYCNENTSFALTAEIHDVRIYNEIIRDIDYFICKNSIKDFTSENLIFSLPVYYYDKEILKKSLVNLNGISSNYYNSDENNISEITLENLVLRGPVNHCFSNKCHGHEVSVENFVYEFKNKVSPNIIFNNDIVSDLASGKTLNILAFENSDGSNPLSPLANTNSKININTKKGNSVNSLYYKKLYEISLPEIVIDHQFYYENFFTYRNNFIMPCDNGIQSQYRNSVAGYYDSLEDIEIHKNSFEINDLEFISTESTFRDSFIYMSNNIINEISDRDLFDYTQNSGEIKDLEERNDFIVNNEISFKENYDVYKNVSLNNFHRNTFSLQTTLIFDNNYLKYKSNSVESKNITIGRSSFLKDSSNQVARKINSNFNSSIAFHLPNITEKILSVSGENRLLYYKTELPIYNLNNDKSETYSKSLCISTQLFGRKVERDSIEIFDSDLAGTLGCKKVKLKDNGKGNIYRADCLTKHATWNSVGSCFYKEGIINILHPSLENFAESGYQLRFKSSSKINVLELNLPAYSGKTNKSYNKSFIENLRLNESAFNSDEDFVYITDINLHDKNLNILAKAKIVKPYPKKSSDNVLFRLKMDF